MRHELAENFWRRSLNGPNQNKLSTSWTDEVAFLYQNGIAIEETIRYLHFERPSLDDFLCWIQSRVNQSTVAQADQEIVLSADDLAFFRQNGYVILPMSITAEAALATQNAIWDFLGMSPGESSTWYRPHPARQGLMVQFSDHPALNQNRESHRILKAYQQLYGSVEIYKTIDKVSFNPPVIPNHHFMGSPLHWDVSLKLPIPFRLQGLIYLSDCNENDGAFHCVPGFHRHIEKWMDGLPAGANPREVALQTLSPVPVTGKAGDMVIWHQTLPHCATPNLGTTPRMVQYLSYFPKDYKEADQWI